MGSFCDVILRGDLQCGESACSLLADDDKTQKKEMEEQAKELIQEAKQLEKSAN